MTEKRKAGLISTDSVRSSVFGEFPKDNGNTFEAVPVDFQIRVDPCLPNVPVSEESLNGNRQHGPPAKLKVRKRNGELEDVAFDKITKRLKNLKEMDPPLSDWVDEAYIAQKVVGGITNGISTVELDLYASQVAAELSSKHFDYDTLAARIMVSNLHKQTSSSLALVIEKQADWRNPKTNEEAPRVTKELLETVRKNRQRLEDAIDYSRDYLFNYFGFKTLLSKYLVRLGDEVVERPQHLWMRVSLGLHGDDIDAVLETYDCMSRLMFTHATPTLYHAGTPFPQLASCFLTMIESDSIDGIYKTLRDCAKISKYAGGLGISISNIRASKSYIKGTNGTSNGIVPMLRVYNDTARYVDQGGGKRKGSFAIYLEPWHADILEFLELKRPGGKEENKCRDLFYALWMPDLFMKRVRDNGKWSLFCPHEAPGLCDTHGKKFEELYEKYEATPGLARREMNAQDLWFAILETQIETGTPYLLYKDACNAKSNQQHRGVIRSSNLCCEIVEYTAPDEVAVCNLASISLPKFINAGVFDRVSFMNTVKITTRNLNKVVDINYYPIPETRNSNMRERAIAQGIQGFADLLIALRIPFDSQAALELNREIFEAMYFAACEESCELAKKHGPYPMFEGSPMSQGKFQFDLWGVKPSDRHDWEGLRKDIMKYGMRNSLLIGPMPTATTSQILGQNECFEPYTTNMYVRRVLDGEFMVVNRGLVQELINLDLWDERMHEEIQAAQGSIQGIERIPDETKKLFKTAWEIPMKAQADLAIARGPFIDQSQSFNAFIAKPTKNRLTSMHFYTWEKGLKTGMYYLRTRPAADSQAVTVEPKLSEAKRRKTQEFIEKISLEEQASRPLFEHPCGDSCTA